MYSCCRFRCSSWNLCNSRCFCVSEVTWLANAYKANSTHRISATARHYRMHKSAQLWLQRPQRGDAVQCFAPEFLFHLNPKWQEVIKIIVGSLGNRWPSLYLQWQAFRWIGEYKPEGRGFQCLRGYSTFLQFSSPFQPHHGPGVYAASNRNEYQKIFLGTKRGRSARATTATCEPIVWTLWDPRHLTKQFYGLLWSLWPVACPTVV
jgi:hypothetical protein